MTEPATDPDTTQETFISHLVELRSRLMKAIIAVVVVLLCLFPFRQADLRLSRGAAAEGAAARQHDDRDRRHRHVSRAAEGDADGGVPDRLAVCALPDVGVCRAGALPPRAAARLARHRVQRFLFRTRHGVRLFRRISHRVRFLRELRAHGRADDDRHRQVSVVRVDDVHRLRHHVRSRRSWSSCWCAWAS